MAQATTTAIQPRSWTRAAEDAPLSALGEAGPAGDAATIRSRLEQHVVGQREPLRELSLLLAMHRHTADDLRAPNAIVIGPTGVGKTHTLGVAARELGLPFVTVDATSLVPAGIVGEQVEDVLEALVRAADGILDAATRRRRRDDEVELAQHGVILVDEFDKLTSPGDAVGSSFAERRAIQRRLLKLAEGARMRVGVRRHDNVYRERYIETAGILLLFSGAFTGLTAGGRGRPLGRGSGSTDIAPHELVEAGFMPELVGRLPVMLGFGPLTTADLVGILDHPGVSPLRVWQRYFRTAHGTELRLHDDAKWAVARRAAMLGMGARALQHVLFPVLAAKAGALSASRGPDVLVVEAGEFMPRTVVIPVAEVVQ